MNDKELKGKFDAKSDEGFVIGPTQTTVLIGCTIK